MDRGHTTYCPERGLWAKTPPEGLLIPWWRAPFAWAWSYITWPAQVRMMKRYGFHRTGWMKWESP